MCLCGSQVCRGSYLNLTGEGAFDKVLTGNFLIFYSLIIIFKFVKNSLGSSMIFIVILYCDNRIS